MADRFGEGYVEVKSFKNIYRYLQTKHTFPPAVGLNHVSVRLLLESGVVSGPTLAKAEVFTVVRDPYERFDSAFYNEKDHGNLGKHTTRLGLLRRLALRTYFPPTTTQAMGIAFFRPQVGFLEGLEVDSLQIVRFDQLERYAPRLPRLRPGKHHDAYAPYTYQEERFFQMVYHADIALWQSLH